MNPFEMVVIIVVVVIVGGVIKSHIERHKPGQASGDVMDSLMDDLGLGDYATKSSLAPYLAKIDAMEERIRVLERIATDKGRALNDEISRL